MHLIFEITHKCPAKCPQCPLKTNRTTIDVTTFGKAINMFRNVPSRRYLLTISGGEPSVLDNLAEYVREGKNTGYTVTIVTNGYNPERVVSAKPDAIQVSIDYYGKRHDENRGVKLWDNIQYLLRKIERGEVAGFARMTLTKDNIQDLKKVYENFDVPILAMPIKGNHNKTPTEEQIKEAKKYAILPKTCPVGKGQFVLTPELRALDCIFTRNFVGSLNPADANSFEELVKKYGKLDPYPCIR